MKKRILMCAESSHIGSGFGNYTKNILQRLYDTGKYEIAELSCYRDITVPKNEPWKIYPVAVKSNHPLYKEYASNEANQFGQWRFDLALTDFKPHIVFDVRDFWNFLYQETSPLRSFYHWVLVPTYDSAPPKIETVNTFRNADYLCFHTEWAKNSLVKNYHYSSSNIGPILSDSIDHNIFKPIEYSKSHHKNKFNISSDTFIIGSVMRNQKRKLIPDLIETFAKLVEKYSDKKLVLYLHTSYPDGLGWDLPSLLLEHNVYSNVLLTYKCASCEHFFPSVFRGIKTICHKCQKNANIASVRHSVSDKNLASIYNLFDMYVQYAICEGFGIPPIEAAACSVPVITIDHEAMGEVGKNIGASLVPVQKIFREQETNANRCYPDNNELLNSMIEYINMDLSSLNSLGKLCRQKTLNHYSWDKTAKEFENLFDSIDINKKLDWNSGKKSVDTSYDVNAKNNNHRDIIYDIIDNIIKEPQLKNTNFIEELIKSANDKFVMNGQRAIPFSVESYTRILETYLKSKVSLEEMRTNPMIQLSDKLTDFIEYSKK